MNKVYAKRIGPILSPNRGRVIIKPYLPGEEIALSSDSRAALLLQRILAIPESEVSELLASVFSNFTSRHRGLEDILEEHFGLVCHQIGAELNGLSRERRLLIGAYCTHEYSVEGAALFNPSIVIAPDQSGILPNQIRVILSVRATGEGHISSIEFRTALLEGEAAFHFESQGSQLVTGRKTPPPYYEKDRFRAKLAELGADGATVAYITDPLADHFVLADLDHALAQVTTMAHLGDPANTHKIETAQVMIKTTQLVRQLAASNYVTTFPPESSLSERVMFPAGPRETKGMEDARFVRFVDDNGDVTYYATYTAYDGTEILPQLIETHDFVTFAISSLTGSAAKNKGMALFPRKIGGKYVMLSRKDRENLHVCYSDNVYTWNDATELDHPQHPWELVQIGNCGSPIETAAGWLVITHGVGPMRRYVISAILLDPNDPAIVVGRLPYPLLEPNESERDGYVPNVVYSCGALAHGDNLILPYGISDGAIGVSLVSLSELLVAMTS